MNYSDIMIIFEETIRDMEDLFVTYEQALSLKELGFNESCFGFYDDIDKQFYQIHSQASSSNDVKNITKAPLKQQAFKWFWVYFHLSHNIFDWLDDFEITITEWSLCEDRIVYEYPRFDTYEQAELACIDKLIEIVKNKK